MKRFLLNIKPILTTDQIKRLSNIFDNSGQVVLGVAVLSPIISGVDKLNFYVVVSGIVGTAACWGLSLLFAKKGEEYEL